MDERIDYEPQVVEPRAAPTKDRTRCPYCEERRDGRGWMWAHIETRHANEVIQEKLTEMGWAMPTRWSARGE